METGDSSKLQGIKNVTATDDCFNDHFPLKPVLPGVAIMEAQHSLARELALRQLAERGLTESFPVLCRAEKVKFRLFIQPGDQMVVEATVKSFSDGQCSVATRVTVGGKNAASVLLHFELPGPRRLSAKIYSRQVSLQHAVLPKCPGENLIDKKALIL